MIPIFSLDIFCVFFSLKTILFSFAIPLVVLTIGGPNLSKTICAKEFFSWVFDRIFLAWVTLVILSAIYFNSISMIWFWRYRRSFAIFVSKISTASGSLKQFILFLKLLKSWDTCFDVWLKIASKLAISWSIDTIFLFLLSSGMVLILPIGFGMKPFSWHP